MSRMGNNCIFYIFEEYEFNDKLEKDILEKRIIKK